MSKETVLRAAMKTSMLDVIREVIYNPTFIVDDEEYTLKYAVLYNGHVCPLTGQMRNLRLRKLRLLKTFSVNGQVVTKAAQLCLAMEDPDFPLFVWPVGVSLEDAVESFNQEAQDLHMPTLQILCQ